ncbi:MAG TPA: glycerol-3-phosphate dehydrogenase/oxidase [Terriglobia bacterium]|nr:glycerol-3-phosphate dehydrogenase/oxidase [Terriglobia bacterium]
MDRQKQIELVASRKQVSALIIGGGINGLGLLRELALQGIDALLVEKSDFCSGASAASTRIIHGGLRYLENREFRLVKESLRERNRLLNNAPHYVRPLPTTIPIFSWTAGMFHALGKFLGFRVPPHEKGAVVFKIGLWLYDRYAGRQNPMPRHRFSSRQAAHRLRPQLPPEVVCTGTYYDACITYPERLGLELALDAEQASSDVHALNYVRATGTDGEEVMLEDEISARSFQVKPRVVINASGPWIDFTNRDLQRPTQYIGGTKGSHIVLDNPELLQATQGEMLYFVNADDRICLFYPAGGKVIAGSTDIPVEDPEAALCEENEVDYILESVGRVFPTVRLRRSQIVYRFCGVRPLPRSDASTPGEISRDHICAVLPAGNGLDFPIYSLIGGKWTTFRAFAEQVADKVLSHLGRPRLANSENLPIGGGRDFPRSATEMSAWLASLQSKYGLPLKRLAVLLDRYGTRAHGVAEFVCSAPDEPLRMLPEYSRREILFMAEREKIVHLEDLVFRRTMMALLGELSSELLVELASVLSPDMEWSEEKAGQEIERTLRLLAKAHGVKLVKGT